MSDDSRSDIDYSADGDDYDADPAPQVHYADDDGNGQSGDGDNGGLDSDAESVDFAVLPERVQIAVESQLRAELDRVEQEQRERHTEVVRLTQQKDEVGSELYGVQQQLAKMQEQLEVMHEEHSSAMRDREEAETRARDASVRFDQQKQERDEQVRKLERYQAELDRISETLVQVERYNEEMASKIAVKRRETYKAEQDVGQLEKEKKTQDVLIDTLQEQVRAQQETLATLKAQLDAQKAETAAARKALMDANSEMATIHFDRKVLVSQWKSSLVGMQRRDEAMRATESAVQQQKERMLSLDAELAGVEKAISAEQERNGQLSGVVQRLTTESEFLTRQIETSRGRTHEVSAKHSMLIRSLESTDAEIGRLDTEGRRIRGDIARVSKQIENLAAQKKAVEESVSEHTNSELTLRKGSEALARNVAAVQKKVRDREMELALVQNEVARIRMDSLTLTAQNDSLADALAEYERELSQRVATVERFESDIRRKHDEVERKQRELDKLNRRHESIMARKADAGEEADTGPLEATIKNLSRSIDKSQRETEDAQRLWLRAQTDLVTLVNKVSELSEAVQTLRAEQSVLEHKRSRLEGEHGAQEKEMRELKKATTRMHGEMVRINEELASSVRSQHSVAEDNFALESELEAKLAAMEEETAQLRVQIESNREEKRGLMEELVEAERQIMLWEKKIALSKETAETLDPTVGQEDLTRMKKEIHIMQVRYEQLQRDQKKLVDEMERLVYKREMIASKGRAAAAVKQAAASNSNSGAVTRAALQRDVAVRASELEKEKANATRYDAQIRQLYQRQQELAAHASQMGAAVDKDRDTLQEVEQATHRLAMEKYGLIEQKAAMLRLIGKYGEVKDGKYRMTLSVDSVSAELQKAQDKNLKIRTLLQRLRVECPEVATQIDKIVATM